MSLNKSKGNMYPWVTHTHAHLGGVCPHKCTYCYVDSFRERVPKYQGDLRLQQGELEVVYGSGKTIFIENCNDMWAEDVPIGWIYAILNHCFKYPENTYVFQTKNPRRYSDIKSLWPKNCICGITLETNRGISPISNAPAPRIRARDIILFEGRKFVTVEPILDFDVDILLSWIKWIDPEFVNIGADSKGHGLQEPPMAKVQALIDGLDIYGIEIREKHNLERLKAL